MCPSASEDSHALSRMREKNSHKTVPWIKTFRSQTDRLGARSDRLMAASNNRIIMLVDSDPNACYLLSMILKINDFEVAPFTDPELALASFGKDQYDMLLIDVKAPDMRGFELFKKIRKIDRRVKVCFITNHRHECMQKFKESFPELAPDSLVDKPVSGNDLLRILQRHI
jgi:DNA-binding response OmpR family regulator